MAYAHAGRYGTDSLTRRNGRPVPAGTEVVVYEAGTTTPATLYADRDRAPADNPAVVTALGNLTFFAEPGEYDLLVGSTTLRVVAVPDPRDTDSGGTVTSVNGEVGVVVLDAADVGAVPNDAVGLLPGETNRGAWDVAETYAVGDVVFEPGDDLYVATAPSTGAQPSLAPGSWDALDWTGRHVHLGPGATAGDYGTAIAPAATAGDYGTAIAPAATAGDYGTAIAPGATAGDFGTAIGPGATAGDFGTAIGPGATAGDYGVNIANIYTGTLDPGNPTVPTGATIATGFVDLPETADATNPAADHQRLIARTDGLYVRDQAGTEVGPLGATERLGHVDAVANAATFPGRAPIGPNHAPTGGSTSHGMSGVGREAYVPFFCPAGTYDSIGVNVTAAAASTWRIGVADMASTGWPGEILLDAGTLDMSTATGWRALAIGFVVDRPRWMWMQAKCTAFTAAPAVSCLDGVGSAASSPRLPGWPTNGGYPTRALVGCYTVLNRGSGSLDPAAPMTNGDAGAGTGLGFTQTSPLIVMRRSA